jgi:hypothetical protein
MAGAGDTNEVEDLGQRVDHLLHFLVLEGETVIVPIHNESRDAHLSQSVEEAVAMGERSHDFADVIDRLRAPSVHPETR